MGMTDAVEWVQAERAFSAQEIGDIRKTVAWLPGLARKELAATLCEHLHWHTTAGAPKIDACQKLLARLEAAGLVALSALRREQSHGGPRAAVMLGQRSAAETPLAGPLCRFEPVCLEVATSAAETGLWNEYVERFHPLGYKGAFGYRLRYFIRSGAQPLGCVLLGGAAKAIAVRDRWDRLGRASTPVQPAAGDQQQPISDLSPRSDSTLGEPRVGAVGPACACRLAAALGIHPPAAGDLRRSEPLSRHLLPGGGLGAAW